MALNRIAAVVAVCISASLAAAQDEPAQSPDPEDAVEILELQIGQDPSRHATPLAAMHGRATLYTDYRERAGGNDETALRIWLLLADFSVRSADASLTQSYAADLVPIYRRDPAAVLSALAAAPWLAPSTCQLLAAHFGSEDRPGSDRPEFLASESERIKAALPDGVASECLALLAEGS